MAIRESVSRRDFLKFGLAGAAWLAAGPRLHGAETPAAGPDVWVFHGPDPEKLMQAALKTIAKNGGLGAEGKTLALKVNAAWARTPDTGANTHPALVDAFLAGCKEAKVGKVVMPELPCAASATTFSMSGILDAAKKHGADFYDVGKTNKWRKAKLPQAEKLVEAEFASDFLDAAAVVNMPVAKHHGGGGLSMALKNWMGAVRDRGFWHKNNLHQCIADISTFLKPRWTLIDATRTMMDKGPQGPGTLEKPDLLIVSRDQVAADAFAATLFPPATRDRAKYLPIIGKRGWGVVDPAKLNIHREEVA